MKRISIRVIGTKHPPHRLKILPGTTISDIRTYLQLNDKCLLAFAFDPTDSYVEDDDIYSLVMEGERLIASIPQKIDQRKQITQT